MKQALVGGPWGALPVGSGEIDSVARIRMALTRAPTMPLAAGGSRTGVILGPESRVLRQEDSTRVVKTPPPFVASPRGLLRVSLGWVPTLHAGSAGGVPPPSLAALFYGGGSIKGNGPEQ